MKDLSNENIIHIKNNGIEYLQFRKLLEFSDVLKHAYVLKTTDDLIQKSSEFEYDFNINLKNISNKKYLANIESYKTLCENLGLDYENLIRPNQNHTNNIKIVESKINENKPDFNLTEYENTDGLITNKKNIILSATNADCILIQFFDPIKKVISNVHSGWKGTYQKISIVAVQKMIDTYDCDPKDILCFIYPSIRKCHFEVHKDVYDIFSNTFKDIGKAEEFIEEYKIVDGNQKWKIDTVLINKIILKNIGIKEENIFDSNICSVCNKDLIHSYRVEKENYGLCSSIITLI